MHSLRKLILVTAVTAVATLGAAALTSAASQASAGPSPSGPPDTTTIHVVQTNAAAFTNVDVGPIGESVGDYVVITGPLVWSGSSRSAGSSWVTCTVLKIGPSAPLQCVGTTHFATGDIAIQGLFVTATGKHNRLAVTGGTGAYQTAHGEFIATILKDGSTDGLYRLTLHPSQ